MSRRAKPKPVQAVARLPHCSPASWSWKCDGALALFVFAVSLAAFANSLPNAFVYDDITMIRDNPRLDQPWNVRAFFGTSYWGEARDGTGLYRPLTVMSFAIDRALFGPGPFGVHLMNVVANAGIAVLVYVLAWRLAARRDLAVVAALLFGLHPVHTEVVANGVGRAELYSVACALGALLLHLEYARARLTGPESLEVAKPGPVRRTRPFTAYAPLIAAQWLYLASLLFKESTITLPGLALLMEWLVLEQGRFGPVLRRAGRFVLYALPLMIYLAARFHVVGAEPPALQEVMHGATSGQRLLYASETMLRYVVQLVVPWHLCAEYSDYTRLVRSSLHEPLVLLSLLHWVGAAALIGWLVRRRAHLAAFGILSFYLTMIPMSNLLIAIGTIRADRLLYWPSFGFTLAAACGLTHWARAQRVLAYALLVLVLAFYALRTMSRNVVWRDTESLWMTTIEQNPGSAVAWGFAGDIHRARGQYPLAEQAYKRSFELRDGAGFFYPESHNNYAQELARRGDRAGAETHYRLVLKHHPRQFTALVNLGELLLHAPSTRNEAIALLEQAASVRPADFRPYVNLAAAHRLAGRVDPALQNIEIAVRLQPGTADFWRVKAELLAAKGQTEAARTALERARQLGGP